MIRRAARRAIPAPIRLRIRLARRRLRDARRRVRFAERRSDRAGFRHSWGKYERPFIDYPGQEHLGAAKRRNQAILAAYLHGVVVSPGETFSVWRLAPRPASNLGYGEAAALHGTTLTTDVGGAICLLATVLYNAGILAGLEVTERHCHVVDNYGEARYFELGRDAAIEFGYQDLRFRNPHAVALRLSMTVTGCVVSAEFSGPCPAPFSVDVEVYGPRTEPGAGAGDGQSWSPWRHPSPAPSVTLRTVQTLRYGDGSRVTRDLGQTTHLAPRP